MHVFLRQNFALIKTCPESCLYCPVYSSVDCRTTNTMSNALRIILDKESYKILVAAGLSYTDMEDNRTSTACEEVLRLQIQGINTDENTGWLKDLCKRISATLAGVGIELIYTCNLGYHGTENFLWDLGQVCDGVIDCSNGHDELYCPERFYSSGLEADHDQVSWIDEGKVCQWDG
eukprot:sb/3471929/